MSDDGFFEGLEELGEGALHYAAHAVEGANETLVGAFEEAGVLAQDAEGLVSGEARAIPVIGEVAAVAGVVYHAGAAVYDGATGDWDGAADHSLSMSESALGAATFGVSGMVEGGWDVGNGLGGGGEETSAHGLIGGALHDAGDWLGDTAYNLINGDESQQ
jgi:hypothetical protein